MGITGKCVYLCVCVLLAASYCSRLVIDGFG